MSQVWTARHGFDQLLKAFSVNAGRLRPRVEKTVFKFGRGPRYVQRDGRGADERARKEGDRPFGQIAHDDGDPIALCNALADQLGQRDDGLVEIGERGSIVFIDKKFPIRVNLAFKKYITQGPGSGFPHSL